jgi:hypothetical protein
MTTNVDSTSWTCASCGGACIGGMPDDRLCRGCAPAVRDRLDELEERVGELERERDGHLRNMDLLVRVIAKVTEVPAGESLAGVFGAAEEERAEAAGE